MNTRQTLLFCSGSLALTLGLAAALYPFASVSEDALLRSRTAQAPEDMADVNLGPDFGTLPVIELMGYYMENPPAPPEPGTDHAPRRQQFGGC